MKTGMLVLEQSHLVLGQLLRVQCYMHWHSTRQATYYMFHFILETHLIDKIRQCDHNLHES